MLCLFPVSRPDARQFFRKELRVPIALPDPLTDAIEQVAGREAGIKAAKLLIRIGKAGFSVPLNTTFFRKVVRKKSTKIRLNVRDTRLRHMMVYAEKAFQSRDQAAQIVTLVERLGNIYSFFGIGHKELDDRLLMLLQEFGIFLILPLSVRNQIVNDLSVVREVKNSICDRFLFRQLNNVRGLVSISTKLSISAIMMVLKCRFSQ